MVDNLPQLLLYKAALKQLSSLPLEESKLAPLDDYFCSRLHLTPIDSCLHPRGVVSVVTGTPGDTGLDQ